MDASEGKILIVDDDPLILKIIEKCLNKAGFQTMTASDGRKGEKQLATGLARAVLLDLNLPDISGKILLERFQREQPGLPIVVVTTTGDVKDVVECMRLGAVDYVQKPVEPTRLVTTLKNALTQAALRTRVESLVRELRQGEGFSAIIGESSAIREQVGLMSRAASSDISVLLLGESGTGKEVAARAIHAESARRSGPFVAVNCGAIPETLMESELFGHEKGAFTGATKARRGLFEQADQGTIFLDEIGELRVDLQVRLLRVLQDKVVTRVGDTRGRVTDVRVIAATNRDIKAEVENKNFRQDLYYRLAVFPIELPPLRDRDDDVTLLASVFIRDFAARHGRTFGGLSARARRALKAYSWPGNIRELKNVTERAVLLEDGREITLASLSDEVVCALDGSSEPIAPGAPPTIETKEDVVPLADIERQVIERALELTGWSVQEAAKRLGIGRATLYRRIEQYGLKQSS